MPAVALATDAVLVLKSSSGERRIPAEEFFLGTYETAANPDELLVEVRIPVAPEQQGWGFREMSVRKGDFALTGVAATLTVAREKIASAALAVCGVGDRAQRLRSVEASLIGGSPNSDAFARAGEQASAALDPQTDLHADAAYRRDLVRTLVERALVAAAERST
jgi:CO/xanthine dehydrogenase FAD-binding subunit